ncbi:MAG: rRNA maturation RNase YbeY [Roseiflexaceae bacterium]|nr:rRNA maturation RNase YbeY [Roseiflexaceae bacterium]
MHEIDIQVDERFAAAVETELIERAVAAVLAGEGIDEPVELSVLVSGDDELHRLNLEYRGVDQPTDVLSFGSEDATEDAPVAFVRPEGMPRFLGDLAISYDRVLAQAAEYGHSPARELAFLAAHGLLHLLGYDHERGPEGEAAMRQREEAAMQRLGLER